MQQQQPQQPQQPQQSPGLGRSPVVLAALILGGCVVAASLILAFGGRRDRDAAAAMSPLLRRSVERQVRAQLREALGEGFVILGKPRKTGRLRVEGARFAGGDRDRISVYYHLTMDPGGHFYAQCLLQKRAGGYYEEEHRIAPGYGGPVARLRVR